MYYFYIRFKNELIFDINLIFVFYFVNLLLIIKNNNLQNSNDIMFKNKDMNI